MTSLLLALLLMAAPRMPASEVRRARALEEQARAHQQAGRYAEAERPLQDAISLWTKYRGASDIEVLNDSMNLAVAYRRRGDAARAVPSLERVSKALGESTHPDAPALRRAALNNLAAAYHSSGRLKEAQSTWESLLELIPSTPPSEERARVLDNLASLLSEGEALPAAKAYAKQGYAAWRSLKGDEDEDTAISLATLGYIETLEGDLASGRTHLEQSLAVTEKLLGKEHPRLGEVLNLLGGLELKAKRPQVARGRFQRALDIGRKRLAPGHPMIQQALAGLRDADAAR